MNVSHVSALSLFAALAFSGAHCARAQEVTLIAPGGMRCALEKITPTFNAKSGDTLKATIGSGGGTHQQVVKGDPFDVPVVQPPYQDVIDSGNVVPATETPLASVAVGAIIRKGDRKPDISSGEALKKALLSARAITYTDGAGGRGGAAGVSFDATLKKLGIYDQIQPKVKRVPGAPFLKPLIDGDVDLAFTFISEVHDPAVEVVGPLPADVSTPTALVGFVSSHTKSPDAAKTLLSYLSSAEAGEIYRTCSMTPSH